MEVIITIQFCAIGLFLYLLNANNNQIWRLKNEQRGKDDEIRNLNYALEQSKNENTKLTTQLQNNKNFLRQPTVNFKQGNDREISKLNKEITEKRNEIFELQRKLRDIEIKYSDLDRVHNNWINANNELRSQLYESENTNNELRKQLYESENANNELRKQIAELKEENSKLGRNLESIQAPLPFSPTSTKTERFVQVIFQKYSHVRYDYLLGDNPDVKVGDHVKVWANGRKTRAKVLKISSPDEVSPYAKTPIIEKIYDK